MQTATVARKPIALVLGANGRLGAAAVEAFAAAGWAVLAQARRVLRNGNGHERRDRFGHLAAPVACDDCR